MKEGRKVGSVMLFEATCKGSGYINARYLHLLTYSFLPFDHRSVSFLGIETDLTHAWFERPGVLHFFALL